MWQKSKVIGSKSKDKRKTGVSRNGNASHKVRSRCSLLEITGAQRRKGEGYEHPKAHRLQCYVCCTGSAHGNNHATSRAILRDWTSCLCQIGEGCSGGCFRVSAGSIPEGLWFLPSESSPDAGVLPHLRKYSRTGNAGQEDRLDAECGHSGGGSHLGGAGLVSAGGGAVQLLQEGTE